MKKTKQRLCAPITLIQKKGAEYCQKHCSNCNACPLNEHTMCINTLGNLCINTNTISFTNFALDLGILLTEIGVVDNGQRQD